MTHYPNAAATGLIFRKSSRSTDQANCVECANQPGEVVVRDSKNPTGPALRYPTPMFEAFLTAVATGTLVPVAA
ncbi:DUF397 domain-containing protein [Kitasatospora sp. NPDC092286]|uniref:DUF397 domain-containing protein n=1 Tax=Kitasatospora sp. NPDC092286 TaxID=3364087 RepID=UPI00380D406A